MSRSGYGVLRGLHLQNPMTQGKLVSVLRGRVLDVAVDVRLGSPNFGRHVAVELSEENRRQLWVPRGFAHGFVVLSETADFFYKCDELYSPKDEISVRWDDPAIGISWGVENPSLSAKDAAALLLSEIKNLPVYRAGVMRIVLTGVTGQVGKALIGPLGRLGDVVPADRSVLNSGGAQGHSPRRSIAWRRT